MLQRVMSRFGGAACRLFQLDAVRRLARKEDGAAAVEFAMVVAPFLALLFAIMETSLIFFAQQTLEKATGDAARLIFTGQQQATAAANAGNANYNAFTDFQKKVCDPAHPLPMFDCTRMSVDVQSYGLTSFSGLQTANPWLSDPNYQASYNPGGPGCIIVVRVIYRWPVFNIVFDLPDLMGQKQHIAMKVDDGTGGNYRTFVSTAVFRNEPYGNQSSC